MDRPSPWPRETINPETDFHAWRTSVAMGITAPAMQRVHPTPPPPRPRPRPACFHCGRVRNDSAQTCPGCGSTLTKGTK